MHKSLSVVIVLFIGLSSQCWAQPGTWAYYKDHFISDDGRVIDHFQNKISHSEGQGYGMLLSIRHNDFSVFETVRSWTFKNLNLRKDGLFAWSWGKRATGDWGVIDINNATDGDILIAWALLEAGSIWKRPDLTSEGLNVMAAIKNLLIVRTKNQMLLLPGYFGFAHDNEIRLNPSYFVYPAFQRFSSQSDPEFWNRLSTDCLALTQRFYYTRFNLPPDWVLVDQSAKPLEGEKHHGNFGYEAIRVPLYLAMAGKRAELSGLRQYLRFFGQLAYLPRSVNLFDETVSLKDAPAGFHAIMGICAGLIGEKRLSSELLDRARFLIRTEKDDYYSNTLYLLALTVESP